MLPVVIIAGREAIRAVPPSIREGSMALGATQWQTIWRQVLPAAIPGIATGVILALSRAIGETAPLIVVGAATFVAFDPDLFSQFTALPIQIFDWVTRPSNDVNDFAALAAGAIIVLMVLLLFDERGGDLATQSLRAEVVGDLRWRADDRAAQGRRRGARGGRRAQGATGPREPRSTSARPRWRARRRARRAAREAIFGIDEVGVSYNGNPAVRDITFDIGINEITALIGPSGCGKSTLIRCLNRMNDLIPGAEVTGTLTYHGQDLYASTVDAVEVRKRIGMVFQKPNPFPKSIYENIAFGPRVLGMKGDMDEIVESALRRGALWDEVKDRLKTNAFGMSGGQQQRLCIARALATDPDVILMDEPCSALDPISTGKIEDLMLELRENYSIVIVTHNMQQAARVSDMTAFFTVQMDDDGNQRTGRMVEFDDTEKVFTNPSDERTEAYVTGKMG